MQDNQPQKDNIIKKFHGKLCEKVGWYSKWHKNPLHKIAHLFFLAAFIVFFFRYDFPELAQSIKLSNLSRVTLVAHVGHDNNPSNNNPSDNNPSDNNPSNNNPSNNSGHSNRRKILSVVAEEIFNQVVSINSSQPKIKKVTSIIPSGNYKSGAVPIRVVFNEEVFVSGKPQLLLATGSPSVTPVDYLSGSGTNSLIFYFKIVPENFSKALDYESSSALVLNNGSQIEDGAGNDADLTLPSPGSSFSLSGNKQITIEESLNN